MQTIEAVDRQDRWGEIAELRNAYRPINDAVRANDQAKAREAMVSFRLMAQSSPDLTVTDSDQLAKNVDDRLKVIFGAPVVGKVEGRNVLPDFDKLGLYGKKP